MSAGGSQAMPWAAVDAFLAFVAQPQPASRADWRELVHLLDALAMARHACPEADYFEAEVARDDALRTRLAARFPGLGYYSVVPPWTDDGDLYFESPMVGDAIDDLLDITDELRHAVWLRECGRSDDAAATLAWSFDMHWGKHLRELQGSLHHALTQGRAGD